MTRGGERVRACDEKRQTRRKETSADKHDDARLKSSSSRRPSTHTQEKQRG